MKLARLCITTIRFFWVKTCKMRFSIIADKFETHRSNAWNQQGGRGYRLVGLLSQRGVGHSRRTGRETREVLSLLPGTLRGHILQHNPEAKNAVLHRQPDRALRGHILSVGAGVLSAGRL